MKIYELSWSNGSKEVMEEKAKKGRKSKSKERKSKNKERENESEM